MNRFSAGCHFAVLAILCTLAIFLFPAVRGPFPATHGPATSLEITRAWQWLCLFLAVILLIHLARRIAGVAAFCFDPAHRAAAPRFLPLEELSVLRC